MGQDAVIKTVRQFKKALESFNIQVEQLILFGSHATGTAREDSDIDVLVEFEPGHVPGLGFIRLQRQLSELFERQVDLNTPQFLSRYFRDQVLREAEVLYAQE